MDQMERELRVLSDFFLEVYSRAGFWVRGLVPTE